MGERERQANGAALTRGVERDMWEPMSDAPTKMRGASASALRKGSDAADDQYTHCRCRLSLDARPSPV